MSVAQRLGCRVCEPHTCLCGKTVDARGLHGLACSKSASRHQRQSQMNDLIWRAVKRAKIPAVKEPEGFMQDGNRPDGATLIPWARGKPLAWDVTVPDTYAVSHIHDTAIQAGAAADRAAISKRAKCNLGKFTHLLSPLHRNRRFMESKRN